MKVIVLMSAYNGEKYIREQIDSILAQTLKCSLYVRDDGSSDSTPDILDEYQSKGLLKWYGGTNLGTTRSFLHLIQNAGEADYYAFADQDDVWLPGKIEAGVAWLEQVGDIHPKLYFCKKKIVDARLCPLPVEDVYVRSVKPGVALLDGVASGCTMVLDFATKKLLEKLNRSNYSYLHDVLVYRLVSLTGEVFYDDRPFILYRQHNNNVVGCEKKGVRRWIQRFALLPKRISDRKRSDCAKALLDTYGDIVKSEYKSLLYDVAMVPEKVSCRLKLVFSNRLFTHHKMDIVFLKCFILLGWF